jgi:predicted nucleotidyltransferase
MKVIAIICEYNPFHKGHERQINIIRDAFGADSVILSLMSGNWVQRGEAAVCDKYARAKAAVKCGSDIVLELPFPWSSGCAEHFARAAVEILNSVGNVDYLCFGCESFELEKLALTADRVLSDEYTDELAALRSNCPQSSDILLRCEAYQKLYGENLADSPNDILALEYMKALRLTSGKIAPFPILRKGVYTATESRKMLKNRDFDALREMMPKGAFDTLCDESTPNTETYGNALISHLRLFDGDITLYEDCTGGLGERLLKCAAECRDYDDFVTLCSTKKYTDAKIRRACLNSLLGINRDILLASPAYTTLLALSQKGREALNRMNGDFIVTKPAHITKRLADNEKIAAQYALSAKAEALYALLQRKPSGDFIKKSPYIVK